MAFPLRTPLTIFSLVAAVGATAGCGAGTPAAAARPTAPTAATGLGEVACSQTPLVIDLPAAERARVEAALTHGRTLLAHRECSSGASKLTVLTQCELFVGYDYSPLTRREEVVRMHDADAVRAHLPLTGEGLAANLSAELSRGSTLDLALVNVGRFVSRTKTTYADDVPKGCEAANVVVSGISTGAFAMSVGTRAHARAVAEIFAAGASGASQSELVRSTRDGDLAACDGTGRGAEPPAQCRAPLRIDLQPIDPRSRAQAKCEDGATDAYSCDEWLRRALSRGDAAGARAAGTLSLARCRAGQREACRSARMYAIQARDKTIDLEEIEPLACAGGDHDACTSHAQNLMVAGKVDDAFALLKSTCFFHDRPSACVLLGLYVREDRVGPPPGAARDRLLANLHARGCQTNSGECERYAAFFKRGIRAEGDFSNMQKIVQLCADKKIACAIAAGAHALAIGVPRDMSKAKKAWAMHCKESKPMYVSEQRACEMPKVYGR